MGPIANATVGFTCPRLPARAQADPALKRKEAELAAKEKQLKELEAKLTAAGATIVKKNWPM